MAAVVIPALYLGIALEYNLEGIYTPDFDTELRQVFETISN